ncbi:MAG: SPASM domain-containing protein [Fibrobacter sp.]|nr:SPASM domain-containing protein [Fibrobacter sp.]
MNGVYIEITDVCNLHCSFCPSGKRWAESQEKGPDHSASSAQRIFLPSDIFERCLKEAAAVADQVYFHVLGEPTLHPGFGLFLKKLEQVSAARSDGKLLQLNLTTNGTTIARSGKAILASPAVRQVNFSTHAYAELPFDEAAENLQNVLDFCRMAAGSRPDLYINLRLWNVGDESSDAWNNYMLEQVNKVFGRINASGENSVANQNHVVGENRVPITLEHFCSRHKSFLVEGRIYIHQDSRFEWPDGSTSDATSTDSPSLNNLGSARPTYPKGTCRALDTHCAILHDGRVVACCLDHSGQITLGHIQENSLAEILSSPMATEIREGFANHELRHPFCQSCSFCKRFK